MFTTAKKSRSVLCILMACVFLFMSAVPKAYAEEKRYFSDFEHSDLDFSEMEYTRYDSSIFSDKMQELKNLSSEPGNNEAIISLYNELLDEIDYVTTMYVLADIHYYFDVQDDAWQAEQIYMIEQVKDVYDIFQIGIRDLLDTSYNGAMTSYLGHELASTYRNYEELTPEEKALSLEEAELVQDYYELAAGNYTDDQEYNEVIGEKFLELRDCRIKMAADEGYDNYAEYASFYYYYRDMEIDEIKKFCNVIKQELVPLYLAFDENYSDEDLQLVISMPSYEPDEIIEMVGRYVGDISYELENAWNYMTDHKLYDIGTSETKADIGFTISLPYYNAAFIYDSPVGSASDVRTMIHEFGHFTNDYYRRGPSLYEYDIPDLFEVHSQGLEVLYLDYFPDMFGEAGDAFVYDWFYDITYTIIYYAYITELEMWIYENPDAELSAINQESKRLLEEYKIDYYGAEEEEDYDWTYSSHMMMSPMYSLSYAVSGMAVLNIWQRNQEDRAEAVDQYLTLLSLHDGYTFSRALELAGFDDILSRSYAQSVRNDLSDYFHMEEITERFEQQEGQTRAPAHFPVWIMVSLGGALLLAMTAIITALTIVRRRHD